MSSPQEKLLVGGGSSVDPRAARKAKNKAKREERKIERKNRQMIKLYTPEEESAYSKKRKEEARMIGNEKKKLNTLLLEKYSKEPTISYDKLTGPYSQHSNVSILLELCSKYIVSISSSCGKRQVRFSPEWIELLALVKYIIPPSHTIAYKKQLEKDGSIGKKVRRIREPSYSTWMSIHLFFALHKLTLKFIAKKPMKLKHVEGASRCIKSINNLIKNYNDYSPRLQKFFNLLGVPPTIVISRAHIPVAKALIGIADRSPINASLFPTEKPFDGKLKEECGICFLLDSEPATCLDCKHIFHTACIELWFKKDRSCASCRAKC
jgi:hypothetical protein